MYCKRAIGIIMISLGAGMLIQLLLPAWCVLAAIIIIVAGAYLISNGC